MEILFDQSLFFIKNIFIEFPTSKYDVKVNQMS